MELDKIKLVQVGFAINRAISLESRPRIPRHDIYAKIDDGTIFEFVRAMTNVDIVAELRYAPVLSERLLDFFQRLANVSVPSDFLLKEDADGLHLLLAYVLEGLQNGTD